MKFKLDLSCNQLEEISGRKALLFDISIWNRLADKKTSEAKEVCEILLQKQNKGEIFCPLAAPAIWELRKQAGESFMRTANLMEELSLNITFRNRDQIIDSEIDNFLEYLLTGKFVPLSQTQIYGSLISYLSPYFDVVETDVGQKDMLEPIGNLTKNVTLTDLMIMMGENSSPAIKKTINYQKINIDRRKTAGGNKNKMRRMEIELIAKSTVIPRMNKKRSKLSMEKQLCILAKVKKFPQSKKYSSTIEHILHFLPFMNSYVDILTISGYDTNRKDSENDFYDLEIMTYGLSYSSIFCAKDKWINYIMKSAIREGNIGGLCYVANLAELKKRLLSL